VTLRRCSARGGQRAIQRGCHGRRAAEPVAVQEVSAFDRARTAPRVDQPVLRYAVLPGRGQRGDDHRRGLVDLRHRVHRQRVGLTHHPIARSRSANLVRPSVRRIPGRRIDGGGLGEVRVHLRRPGVGPLGRLPQLVAQPVLEQRVHPGREDQSGRLGLGTAEQVGIEGRRPAGFGAPPGFGDRVHAGLGQHSHRGLRLPAHEQGDAGVPAGDPGGRLIEQPRRPLSADGTGEPVLRLRPKASGQQTR